MKTIFAATLAATLVATALPASADTMQMHSLADSPANNPAGVPRPERGLSMDTVRARFGDPGQKIGPVGEPPITRWVYGDYTVYFEGNRVIHSVVHSNLRAARGH